MKLFTTEAVTKFHPDKYADQISDAIVTACMREDRNSRCGVETLVKGQTVVVAGEIKTNAHIDLEAIVHRVAWKLGYRVSDIVNLLSEQSPEISKAVDGNDDLIGAGDQGVVFGYANSECESMLPMAVDIANRIVTLIEHDVDTDPDTILKGDSKTQVTIDLDTGLITDIVVSACHKESATIEEVRKYIRHLLHGVAYPDRWHINPAGVWTVGGPDADCGLTGRKIVCDQYGGAYSVGGGAFSGKDVSKVDRTGTYMARQIAVELCKKFKLRQCFVQMAFVIGRPVPISVSAKGSDGRNYAGYVRKTYDLTVKGMIEYLDLYQKDFEKLAEGCHFFDKRKAIPMEVSDGKYSEKTKRNISDPGL